MAEHTVIFCDEHGNELYKYTFDIWEGNRDKTNRKAIGIAETMYAYLCWKDDEAIAAAWFALGNNCEEFLNRIKNEYNWESGGAKMKYKHLGREMICYFTLNDALGAILAPGVEAIYTQPDKAYQWASRRV